MSYKGSLFPVLEILIRLSSFNPKIGEYIYHTYSDSSPEVIVITSAGKVIIPVQLLIDQENSPETVDDLTLRLLALSIR